VLVKLELLCSVNGMGKLITIKKGFLSEAQAVNFLFKHRKNRGKQFSNCFLQRLFWNLGKIKSFFISFE
jgi:hypothetical protein